MADYSVESDPYLSVSAKARFADQKARGVDLSQVETFLANTAHLVEPVQPKPYPLPLLLAIVAVILALVGLIS